MDLTTFFSGSKTQNAETGKEVEGTATGFIKSEMEKGFHTSKMYNAVSSLKHENDFVDGLKVENVPQKSTVLGDDITGQSNAAFDTESTLPYNQRSYSADNLLQYNNCYGNSNIDPHYYGTASSVERHFPCTYCGKSFTNIASFTRHVRSHEAELPFRCNICLKAFPENNLLGAHLLIHDGETLFKCDKCERSFSETCHLNEHMKSHTGEDKLQVFNQKEIRDYHLKSHVGERPFQCGICGESFSLKAVLVSHLTIHCGDKPVHHERKSNDGLCQESQIIHQFRNYTGVEQFHCSVCNEAFREIPHLKKHLKSHSIEELSAGNTSHEGLNEAPLAQDSQSREAPFHDNRSDEARFKETDVQQQFESEDESSDEMSSDDQLSTYKGENTLGETSSEDFKQGSEDSLSFKTSDSTPHIRTSLEQEKYLSGGNPVCHSVSNAFSGESSLIEHLQSYNEVRPFQCTICKQSFSEKAHVLNHLKTHTGNEVYRCSICEQEFNSQQNLSQHMQLHTGENPFRCQFCDRAFRQKTRLNKHLKIHTGAKPFHCTLCDKQFRLKRALDAHLRSHTGQKPFFCNICEKGFSYQASYNKHLTFQH